MRLINLLVHNPTSISFHTGSTMELAVLCSLLSLLLLGRYTFVWLVYHWAHLHRKGKQVPPTFPNVLPLLGSALPFAFDCVSFIKKATQYAGSLVPVRLSILSGEIFLFQGPETVAAVWKQPQLGSPIFIYTFALKHVFGMPKHALAPYEADSSGSHRKPHPSSDVAPHNRVDFLTHVDLFKAFGGSGLTALFIRCADLLRRNLAALPISTDEWVEMPDFYAFFQDQLGAAVLEGLYGPTLPVLSPGFLRDLWTFDRATPKFAKLIPRFLIPEAYQARERLLESIRRWYKHAREHFDESLIGPDGDADPYWGSQLVRSRQKVLLEIDSQDDDTIAAADLGLIWASVTNVVPSSMMCALHIFRSPSLSDRLRDSLSDAVDTSTWHIEMDKVLRKPLLSSVYAETLRLHLQAYVTRCSPHCDVGLGSWWLPKNRVCMVNTYASHMDASFWNTRDGEFPVEEFWAERFLIDPKDERSGPVRGMCRYEPFFSVQGLEGAWIPYGGGYAACPGRHFAKRIIFYTTSLMLTCFDIQILNERLVMDNSSFGLGTQKPKQQVRFRIRRRKEGLVA
ncbi:cytochrome P450 [Pseudomassariella vexata]|uniref:Cytochrome P450 n=1 Tax=Pseudomassariella vexata TaxID=1141098 RepID=A0A1Y2EF74_9PEZI|nr:cytochrome P450 [Pseudomassariella vexata]ORY70233.1 cytochrome P450 [Pseudomassariella vexata]